MDRFKFRVWYKGEQCVDHKRPDYAMIDTKTGECVYWNGFANCILHMEYVIIEQCTGLKDRNGQLIYEGDVLEFQEDYGEDGIIVQVVWCGDDKYPAFDVSPNDCPDINGLSRMIGTGVVTVIGNIHENQDLLK